MGAILGKLGEVRKRNLDLKEGVWGHGDSPAENIPSLSPEPLELKEYSGLLVMGQKTGLTSEAVIVRATIDHWC